MSKLIIAGRNMFAIGIIALGFLCVVFEDFIIGRPPAWPEGFAFNPALAYISAAIIIGAGLAVVANIKTEIAALIIALFIIFLSLPRHLQHFMDSWLGACKTIALAGGALIIICSSLKEKPDEGSKFRPGKKAAEILLFIGCLFLAIFFIACGYAHIEFAEFVKQFIPVYIPFHGFFTYFTAACLFAGGIGLLLPPIRKWAALLSGCMLTGWFLLLHIPRFIANTNDASDRMGLCESFAFAGVFFVLAAMSVKEE